jgi:spermidine synthase
MDSSFMSKAMRRCRPLMALVALLAAAVPAQARELERVESPYNSIFITKDDANGLIGLTFGYNRRYYTESLYNPRDEMELPVVYTRFMTVALAYRDTAPKNIVEIGFGGGRTSWYLHKSLPDAAVMSVELDPDVIRLAKQYFGIREEPDFAVTESDGRRYLMKNEGRDDLILIDAYRGPFVPFHLLTKEFYELVKSRLAPGGVVAQNVEPSTMLFDAALATVSAVFDNVDVYPADGNVIVVAYSGRAMTTDQLVANGKKLQQALNLRYPLTDLLAHRNTHFHAEPTKVLTDDFAPVEALQAIEVHNRKWASP